MLKEIIQQWDKNKHKLEDYFKVTRQSEYDEYSKIVVKLFEVCLSNEDEWNLDGMTVIDNGDYQGTQIFIIPKDTYQPNIEDYLITNNYYGSCSGCDTLQSISEYDDGLPSEEQVKEYMTLALHLTQKIKILGSE